jgi:hypothetical protein
MEKGAATIDPEKGAAVIVKEVGGHALASSHPASSRHHRWAVLVASDDLASDVLASSPVRCTRGFRRPRGTGWSPEQSPMEIERERERKRRGPDAVQIEREREREDRSR